MRSLLALSLVVGCNPETQFPGGTGVGNPGTTRLQTRQCEEPTILSGTGTLVDLIVDRCGVEPDITEVVEETADLLGSGPFAVPGGQWCAVDAVFDGPLVYAGIDEPGDADGTVELVLDVGVVTIPMVEPFLVDGDLLVLELGHDDWLDHDVIGELSGHTVIDRDHPAYPTVVRSLRQGSAVFVDDDRNGVLDDAERSAPIGAGPLWFDSEDDDDR